MAERHLQNRGYSVYLPTVKGNRSPSDHKKTLRRPMFPGYLFARFNSAIRHRMVDSPCVIRIVGMGGSPTPIDEAELSSIFTLEQSGSAVNRWHDAVQGEEIEVVSGPLHGVEGVFVRQQSRRRVIVQVKLLGQSVIADLDDEVVAPLKHVSAAHYNLADCLPANYSRFTEHFTSLTA